MIARARAARLARAGREKQTRSRRSSSAGSAQAVRDESAHGFYPDQFNGHTELKYNLGA